MTMMLFLGGSLDLQLKEIDASCPVIGGEIRHFKPIKQGFGNNKIYDSEDYFETYRVTKVSVEDNRYIWIHRVAILSSLYRDDYILNRQEVAFYLTPGYAEQIIPKKKA